MTEKQKICERCGQPFKKGEQYAETDYGSGKYTHWPECPQKPTKHESSNPQVKKIEFKEGKWQFDKAMEEANWDSEIFDWMVGETVKSLDAAEKNEFWKQYNEWARLAGYYHSSPDKVEAIKWQSAEEADEEDGEYEYVHLEVPETVPPYLKEVLPEEIKTRKDFDKWAEEIAKKYHAEIWDMSWAAEVPYIILRRKKHHSSSEDSPVTSPSEVFLVDGLTLKDYYDLRDLRLLLWGLEKELIGKYGILEASPLADKIRDLIKQKVEQVTSKIGSSPEHHSISAEDEKKLWALANTAYDRFLRPLRKDDVEKFIAFLTMIIDGILPSDLQIGLSDIVKTIEEEEKFKFKTETHSSSSISKEEAEAEIDVLIDNIASAIKNSGEITPELRSALRKNFMFFKSDPTPEKFDVRYIDLATGKTVEKTIPAKEQFDLYKQQREGKISIISIHTSASSGNPEETSNSGN